MAAAATSSSTTTASQTLLIPIHDCYTKDTAARVEKALAAGHTVELDVGGKAVPVRLLGVLKGKGPGLLVVRKALLENSRGSLTLSRKVCA